VQAEEKALKTRKGGDKDRNDDLFHDRKKVTNFQREMDNLYFAFSGARIFFKEDDDGAAVKAENAAAAPT
jgi:hypothetical protein